MDVHGALAKRLGVDEEVLHNLSDFATNPRFSDFERSVLAATVSLTREPRALPQNLRTMLVQECGEDGFEEIVATIGLFNYLTRLHNGCATTS